jgi:hypothetical protein
MTYEVVRLVQGSAPVSVSVHTRQRWAEHWCATLNRLCSDRLTTYVVREAEDEFLTRESDQQFKLALRGIFRG